MQSNSNQSSSSSGSSNSNNSNNNNNENTICADELSDLISCFNELSTSSVFAQANHTTNSLRRSLSLAIYFLQRGDLERARDAFVKSGELVRLLSTEKIGSTSKLSRDQQVLIQKDILNLFEKVVIVIEGIDKKRSQTQTITSSSSIPTTESTAVVRSRWDKIAKQRADALQDRVDSPTDGVHFTSSRSTFINQEGSNNKSKLKKLLFDTIGLVKSKSVAVKDQLQLTSSSDPPTSNVKVTQEPSATPQQQQQHKDAVQLLQQRLASIMSDRPLPATGSITEPEVTTENQYNMKTISLVELKRVLSQTQGLNPNVLCTLVTLYQQFSLYEHENITTQLQQYAEVANTDKDQSMSIFRRLDSQICSHVFRIVYELECMDNARVIKNEKIMIDKSQLTPEEISQKFAKALNIDDRTQKLLQSKILAEKFEHTYYHLSRSLQSLDQLLTLVQEQVSSMDIDYINGIDSLTQLFIGQCRMRVVELNFCFGALTFSTTTNDYSEDRGVDSLEILIKCLVQVLQIRNLLSLSSNSSSVSDLLHSWLKSAVEKIFIINSEDIRSRLLERNELKSIFFEATRLLYLCEFVTAECNGLNRRFGAVFNKYLLDHNQTFLDIICKEFRQHLSDDVDRFCTLTDQHQMSRIKDGIKSHLVDFELSLGLFHRLCPQIEKTFKYLSQLSSGLEPYPVCDRFYAIIQRCIVFQISTRLQGACARIIENDSMLKPYSASVLYTKSCVELVNACFESLRIVADLDVIVLHHTKKYKSLLVEYFEVIHKVLSIFLAHTAREFKNVLVGKTSESTMIKTMNDKIKVACLYFNNVNGVFTLCKSALTKFNNTTFIQMSTLLSHQEAVSSDDEDAVEYTGEDEEEEAMAALDEDSPVDVFDLDCVKALMSELQITANSIALFFAQFIFICNEKKLQAIFKQFDKNVLEDLLTSLDKFFMVTSEFLYIEQLHEVLKHLFVIYVQKLMDLLLNPVPPSNSPAILASLSFGSTSKHSESFEEHTRNTVEQCLKPLQELFRANGEGVDEQFLAHHSRQLQILLSIYYDSTEVLIELYNKLTEVQPFLHLLATQQDSIATNGDHSDNLSVASSDSSSSCSSMVMIQTIQQQLANQSLSPNELIKPEYILLLLGSRKKDREARHFVKKIVKKNKS